MGAKDEDRFRIYWIDPQLVLTLLGGWRRREFISLPMIDNVPVDAEIHHIITSTVQRAFGLVIWHSSFDVVPMGAEAPTFVGAIAGYATIKVPEDVQLLESPPARSAKPAWEFLGPPPK